MKLLFIIRSTKIKNNYTMENFKEYYKFPLHVDDTGLYISTANNEMALIFKVSLKDDVIQNIVDKLNGKSNKSTSVKWYLKNEIEVWFGDMEVMKVSGWSMLTKIGYSGYGLSEEAIRIQDEFAQYVVDTLNS